jgi:hypothetical protein
LRTQTTNCFDGGFDIAGPLDFGNFVQNLEVHQRSVSKSRDRVNGAEIGLGLPAKQRDPLGRRAAR